MASKKNFIITPYEPGANDILQPQIPTICPCGLADNFTCNISKHDNRERKTGPCFDLTVAKCKTHQKAFTLYPYSHVPYGRKAVAPMSPEGYWPIEEKNRLSEEKDGDIFCSTIFEAAVDASSGKPWPRCSQKFGGGSLSHYWSLMARDLQRLTRLFGLHESQDDSIRENIAEILDVPMLDLKEQSDLIWESPGYKSRGKAVCNVLFSLPHGDCFLHRILHSGHYAGFWGEPYEWKAGQPRPMPICPAPP